MASTPKINVSLTCSDGIQTPAPSLSLTCSDGTCAFVEPDMLRWHPDASPGFAAKLWLLRGASPQDQKASNADVISDALAWLHTYTSKERIHLVWGLDLC